MHAHNNNAGIRQLCQTYYKHNEQLPHAFEWGELFWRKEENLLASKQVERAVQSGVYSAGVAPRIHQTKETEPPLSSASQ